VGRLFQLATRPLEEFPALAVPPSCGAVVSFWGRVRDRNEGREVTGLEYTTYEVLALKEGERIMEEAAVRFGLEACRAVHRIGELALADAAVVVEVATGHRDEAFEACRWIIDSIKARVPIWKREHYAEGDREWVICRHDPTTTGN
jgi:molybdopterin synthase catalytic subunit